MRPSSRSVEPIQRANHSGSSQELANEPAAPCCKCALEWASVVPSCFGERTLPNIPDLLPDHDLGRALDLGPSGPFARSAPDGERSTRILVLLRGVGVRANARGVVGGPGIEPGTSAL